MNKRKLKACSYAKINLSLNVSGKNPQGYHLLDSVAASVNIADAVTVCERFDSRVNVTYGGKTSRYENDVVLKAVNALREQFGDFGVDVAVEKRLPEGAGMGGSSADAAAAIVLLDKLFGFFERGFKGQSTALRVGSDVPYMLRGGFARITGVGENTEFFEAPVCLNAVVALGEKGVDTGRCFQTFDEIANTETAAPSDNAKLISALKKGDFKGITDQCANALTAAAIRLNAGVETRLDALRRCGAAAAFMTGSGSACVGLFREEAQSADAAVRLSAEGIRALSLHTVPRGIEIV